MVLRGIQSNNKSERGIHLPRSLFTNMFLIKLYALIFPEKVSWC